MEFDLPKADAPMCPLLGNRGIRLIWPSFHSGTRNRTRNVNRGQKLLKCRFARPLKSASARQETTMNFPFPFYLANLPPDFFLKAPAKTKRWFPNCPLTSIVWRPVSPLISTGSPVRFGQTDAVYLSSLDNIPASLQLNFWKLC